MVGLRKIKQAFCPLENQVKMPLPPRTLQLVGWVFIPSGLIAFGLGLWKYKKINDVVQGAGKVIHIEQD